MKKLKNILFAIVAIIFMASCSPMSKESYLEKYDDFVAEVSKNHQSYSEKDWKQATEKYEKFSGEWHEKFKDEFTIKDKIDIKANQAKWYYYNNLNDVTSTVKQLFESLDIKGMKKQAQYYIDNDMQSDLQKYYEEAVKAGKDAEKAITEILDELNVKIDELKK